MTAITDFRGVEVEISTFALKIHISNLSSHSRVLGVIFIIGIWYVDAFENTLADMNCPDAGTGKLVKFDFTKYEKRGIRKRNSRIRLPNDD